MTDLRYENIVVRLYSSVTELEEAIRGARSSLSQKPDVPSEVIKRMTAYDEILSNQRRLIHQLSAQLQAGNNNEVGRLINIINHLSGMIIDDAREILTSLGGGGVKALSTDSMNFC